MATSTLNHRLLNEHRRRCEKELRYTEARRATDHIKAIAERGKVVADT